MVVFQSPQERAQQTPAYAFTPPPSRSLARNSTGPIGSASYSGPVSPQRASPSASPCLLESLGVADFWVWRFEEMPP